MSSVAVSRVPVAAVSAPLSAAITTSVRPTAPDARATSVASLSCWSSNHSLDGNCRRASATALMTSSSSSRAYAASACVRCCGSAGGVSISGAGSSRAQSGNAARLAGRFAPPQLQTHRHSHRSRDTNRFQTSAVACQTCTFEFQAPARRRDQRRAGIRSPSPSVFPRLRVVCSAAGARAADVSRATSATSSTLSLTTFNILAPIYKRLGSEGERESACDHLWRDRNRRIVDLLLSLQSSVVCLQEFWFDGGDLERLYESQLQASGYTLYKLPRTNSRGDGLLTAVRTSAGTGARAAGQAPGGEAAAAAAEREVVSVVDYEPILFHDCGDRVAQLLRLRVKGASGGKGLCDDDHDEERSSSSGAGSGDGGDAAAAAGEGREVMVINTHLLFPHNANSSVIRLREVYKILEYVDAYKHAHGLGALPILLAGDLNGPLDGEVCRFLRSQGFVSCYDSAQGRHDDLEDASNWVSHRNHHGEEVGVDFIWLLNPSQQLHAPLTADWKAAVFRMIKAKLVEAGITEERQAFEFFQAAGTHSPGAVTAQQLRQQQKDYDCITPEEFAYAMDELGLTGEDSVGLTREEIEQLVRRADVNGCGAVDYEEFKLLLRTESMEDTFARICKATGIHEQPWQQPRPQHQQQQQQQEPLFESSQTIWQQPWLQLWQEQQQQQGESRCPVKRGVQALQQAIKMDALFPGSSSVADSICGTGPETFPDSAFAPAGSASSLFGSPEWPVPQASSFPTTLGRHGPMVVATAAASAVAVAVPDIYSAVGEKAGTGECWNCDCDHADCEECGYNPNRQGQQGQQQQQQLLQQQVECGSGETRELAVETAELFPPEMQHGTWPSDYDLSDHAAVTAVLRVL
ncbi:hypothetical protein CLOM_g14572 [Closterium sp. NIES-68]|nr:hypothetical protein CLOM_g14572 [Closterium sp. NIES-68]GJP64680.1 hypothetical protein CLOP_g21647 [Closterium sp. NIES-67]